LNIFGDCIIISRCFKHIQDVLSPTEIALRCCKVFQDSAKTVNASRSGDETRDRRSSNAFPFMVRAERRVFEPTCAAKLVAQSTSNPKGKPSALYFILVFWLMPDT
jgi:hypothetical protein